VEPRVCAQLVGSGRDLGESGARGAQRHAAGQEQPGEAAEGPGRAARPGPQTDSTEGSSTPSSGSDAGW
jgi:hypothetical protein